MALRKCDAALNDNRNHNRLLTVQIDIGGSGRREERKMRISFDLDDTLICYGVEMPCERFRAPALVRRWFREPLRLGTVKLIEELTRQGCEVWIYTTSSRSPVNVLWWLRMHGVKVRRVITQEIYDRDVPVARFSGNRPSKYPPAFGIDLHVDDSEGVFMEGQTHRFDVVVINPADREWTKVVLEAVGKRTREEL